MIPASTIQEIIDAAHIEDVVGDYVSLKKRGSNLTGLCPFHQEKTPSFSVSPVKGIYKCFGCGKAGNSVNFIMEVEHLNYIQALKHLAEKYSIEWPEQQVSQEQLTEEKRKASERESLQIINNFAEQYFSDILHKDEEGKNIGLSYFEERGFRPETIERFKLGFAKDSWDHFTQTATAGGYNTELLKKGGLTKESEQGKIYDAYRGRVIFPIHSLSGKPIAFAGRYLKKDPKSPKYVNSPETELYHKSNELYGLYFARQSITKNDSVYLVEGYTDVITLFQAGVENVVASSGTSLTENQIKLLKRFTNNVCVLYDGDAAGIKASLRGIDMLLESGMNIKVVLFPDGEDPDSYCQKMGPVAFSSFLDENKKDFILFKTSLLMEDAGNDPVKKAHLLREIVESISKIPDAFTRSNFIRETSLLLKADEQMLINESNKILRTRHAQQNKQAPPPLAEEEEDDTLEQVFELQLNDVQEKDILRLLLSYANNPYEGYKHAAAFILHEIAAEEIELEHPVVMKIVSIIQSELEHEQVNLQLITHNSDPLISTMAADILSFDLHISPNWEKKHDVYIEPVGSNYISDIHSCMLRLKLKNIEKLMKTNQQELDAAAKRGDEENVELHVRIHMHLLERRAELSIQPGTVISK